ncbi:ATP-dependent translocase ABCB1-like [Watersipora subatra]|uniref:ATP-dependent translocase ABCB1-like n=1 Tax=Watersipora subatra TaxID=2589382 RepID=UPI00355B859F
MTNAEDNNFCSAADAGNEWIDQSSMEMESIDLDSSMNEKKALDKNGLLGKTLTDKESSAISSVITPSETSATKSESSSIAGDRKKQEPKVGFFGLFRFADKLDVLLMVSGTLCMAALGAATPLNFLFFGSLLTEFTQTSWAALPNSTFTSPCPVRNSSSSVDDQTLADLIVNTYVVAFCCIGVSAFILAYIGMSFWTWTGTRQICRIQSAYFKAIMSQSIKWFDLHKTGELNSHLVGDVDRLNDGFGDKMGTFIQWVCTFLGGVALGFSVSWKLMLVVLAGCPVLIIVSVALGRLVRSLLKQELSAYARAGSIAEEVFSSMRTVAAFGGEKKAEEKYANSLEGVVSGSVKKSAVGSLTGGVFWFILYCIIGLAFWYGGVLIRTECLEPGAILQVLMAVMVGSMSLGNAAPLLENFSNARAAAAALYETIDAEVEIDSNSDEGLKPESLEGNIEFRDIHFSYPSRQDVKILNGLNLSVTKGQTVALVGESGCGKSTTIQLLQRYYDTVKGQVLIDGKDLKDYNLSSLRNFMGIVGQEPVLFAASIGDNIRLGAKYGEEVTQEQVETAAKESNCYDFISSLPKGFDTMVGERGVQLSGGQKQRIAIARALIRNPAILLLDEATSALDTQSEATVQNALDRASQGRTTIVIAHRLSTVRNASKICAFSKGEVHEEGTHNELMAKEGIYYSLVMRQQQEQKKEVLQIQRDNLPNPPSSPIPEEVRSPILSPSSSIKRTRSTSLRRGRFSSFKNVDVAFPLKMEHGDVEEVAEELPSADRRILSRHLSNSSTEPKFRGSLIQRVLSTQSSVNEAELQTANSISMKEIWNMNRPEWNLISVGVIASFLLGLGQPAFIYLMTELIAVISIPDFNVQKSRLAEAICWLVLVGFCTALFTLLQGFMMGLSGERMTSRLRKQFFSTILKQDIGYFDKDENGIGQLTSRLATDASLVKGATGIRIGILVQTAVSVIGVTVVAFIAMWELALVMLVCFPLVIIAGRIRAQVNAGNTEKEYSNVDVGAQIAQEAISNMRTVTSMNRQKYFEEKFYQHFKNLYKENLNGTFKFGVAFATSASMNFFMYAVAFGLGGYFVVCDCLPWRQNPLEFANIFRVFSAVTFGGVAAGRVFSHMPNFPRAKLAAANVKNLLSRVSPIDSSSPDGETPAKCDGKIKFDDVFFHYPTRKTVKILKGLSFTVERGEIVALVGASGCGKSTSISLLERFYDPIKGSVLLDGKNVNDLNLKWLRQNLGIVSQEPTLFDATIAENIAYGDNTRQVEMAEIIEAAVKSNAHDFITSLPRGYETNVGAKGTQLSGGQKQRIAIARALIRNPAVLLLDEATSALDTQSEKIVQAALDEALKNRSAIVIAHRLSTIRNADKIGVVNNGKVVELGTHDELIAQRGFYYNLVNSQL